MSDLQPFRVLVTGSRQATVAEHEATICAELLAWVRPRPCRVVLVHGDASGVDRIAAGVVASLSWPVEIEIHTADWQRLGKAAGAARNRKMVALGADVCLAFPQRGSVGTWDCARKAVDAGIPVILRSLPGGRS